MKSGDKGVLLGSNLLLQCNLFPLPGESARG